MTESEEKSKFLSFKKAKIPSKKRNSGPLILVVALIGGLLGLVFASQSLMPFALVNRLIEEFNTNGISSVLRSDNILDLQLSSVTGMFTLSEEQESALKDHNIFTIRYGGGKILVYQSGEKTGTPVVGTTQYNNGNSNDAIITAVRAGTNYEKINSPILPAEALKDRNFKNDYIAASKTWRGGNSGWYDSLAELSETIHGYTRSRWYSYTARSASTTITSLFKELAKSKVASSSALSGDAIGGEITETDSGTTTGDTTISTGALDLAAKFTSAASTGASVACAAVEGFLSVQTLITTYQRLQKINLASGYLEAVQKVQAGDGNNSPMNEYNSRLTTIDSSTGKTAMTSAGVGALFSGTKIDADDASVQSINSEKAVTAISESQDSSIMNLFSDIAGDGKGLLKAYSVCNYVKGTLAVANAAFTIASVIPVIGQGLKLFQLTFKAAAKAVIKGLIAAAAPVIAKALIKTIGKSLLNDIATEWLGEDLGNALTSGGNTLLAANHQTGGGSPGNSVKLAEFKQKQSTVLAEEAEYQRSIRSPFDVTSRYTFFGSLAYSLIPFATTSSAGNVVKTLGALTRNSVVSLLPSSSAIAQTEMVGLAEAGDCPTLESIDIQGDAYCNPLYLTDNSTISGNDETPDEIIRKELDWGEISENSDGTYSIKDGSELSKYVMYCGQRVSSWGIADANIANAINDTGTVGKILSAIPIVGDAMQVAEAATSEANLPWTTGKACVASASNDYWDSSSHHNSTHQRFVEDQRFAENIGAIKENSVTAYLKDYYEKNPLDNSYEGILARYSGMTKNDVVATLDFVRALNYIAEYKPENRLVFNETPKEEIFFENTNIIDEGNVIAVEPKYIVYFDIRNKKLMV